MRENLVWFELGCVEVFVAWRRNGRVPVVAVGEGFPSAPRSLRSLVARGKLLIPPLTVRGGWLAM